MTLADVQIRKIMGTALDGARGRLVTKDMAFERAFEREQVRFLHRTDGIDNETGQEFYGFVAVVLSENRESIDQLFEMLGAPGTASN